MRITEFVNGFQNHRLGSVCDASYAGVMTATAASFGTPPPPDCIDATVAADAAGQPACTVVRHQLTETIEQQATIRNCGTDSGLSPCWRAPADLTGCSDGARVLQIQDDTLSAGTSVWYAVTCRCTSGCP